MTGAAAAAAGSAATLGCSTGAKKPPAAPPTFADTPAQGTATATATPRATGDRRGETLRYAGFVTSGGSHDPHKTQSGPFYGHQSLVFSRLLTYKNFATGDIENDLAKAYQQPDNQTYVFTLNPLARWQQRALVNGRQVTAEDVKFSIERQINGDASFPRKARWLGVDKVEVPEPGIVKVTMKSPLATMLNNFADVNAFIVPPELSIEGRDIPIDLQFGSGPFQWVDWKEGQFASVARNPAWFRGKDRPYLDGVDLQHARAAGDLEAGLRTKKLDVVFVGRPAAEKLKKSVPDLRDQMIGNAAFFGMWFFLRQQPFNDERFRQAINIALDRRAMVEKFFSGSGGINPWISWPLSRWSLPQNELTNLPGYRAGQGGRDQDIAEARALLTAYTGDKKLDGEIPLFVVDDAEASLQLGSTVAAQLKANLGLDVKVFAFKVGELFQRMLTGEAPWVVGLDSGSVDLDDWLYPYFHSQGTKNTFALRDPDLDKLIDAQRLEFNEAKRRDVGYEAQRRLQKLSAGLNFVSERVVALAWPYVRDFPLDVLDGYQGRFADCWIDRGDPSFRGRG